MPYIINVTPAPTEGGRRTKRSKRSHKKTRKGRRRN
jgi:hypothetical protein